MTPFRVLCLWLALLALFSSRAAAAESAPSPIVQRLTALHDDRVAEALRRAPWIKTPLSGDRAASTHMLVVACGYANPSSRFHRSTEALAALESTADYLLRIRPESNLYDTGNLDSPPDSGFMVAALMKVQHLLQRDSAPASVGLRETIAQIIRPTAAAIARGGVHTPNHRWDVAAMLASVNTLYPSAGLRERAEAWLAEGIDQDAEGNYSERSPAYSAKVVNPAFIELAELLGRRDLLDHVRRNLELTAHLVDSDGSVTTVASRRQDQRAGARVSIADSYWPARFLALRENNRLAAGLARWIEQDFTELLLSNPHDPNWPLAWLLLHPELSGPLPEGDVPSEYTTFLPLTGLVRSRRGNMAATINGSNDWAAGFGHGSGLATNPAFFTFQKGRASLASVRLTPSFFDTGFFYPQGLTAVDGGWRLTQALKVPYYQPLPASARRADGDYALGPDGRFFAKMSFDQRPRDERPLNTSVTVKPVGDGYVLDLAVDGLPGVAITLELAFVGEGTLTGVEAWSRDPQGDEPSKASVLRDGWGQFRVGDDVIEFGPGVFNAAPDRMWDGHIGWTGGKVLAVGQRVYLTGVTPFRHQLTVR